MLKRDDLRIDLRRRRSDALLAMIINEIADLIPNEADRQEAFSRIGHALHAMGAEIVTDEIRAEMGLPPRDQKGWTAGEFTALERARIDALHQPPTPMVLRDQKAEIARAVTEKNHDVLAALAKS